MDVDFGDGLGCLVVVGLAAVVQATLLVLKLFGALSLGWWLTLFPTLVLLGPVAAFLVIVGGFVIVGEVLGVGDE